MIAARRVILCQYPGVPDYEIPHVQHVLVEDGNVYALDVKATTSYDEITHFMQNVKLYEITSGRKTTRLYLVALRIFTDDKAFAEKLGIHVIHGQVLDE